MALRITLVLTILSVAGCGAPTAAPVDGGADAWARPDAPPGPDSCDMDHLHVLDGVPNGTVGIDFDTALTETRPRDLGLGCGNPSADIRWAPQEVVAFHVPGTGMQAISFSTANSMTALNFNTLIQVRTGSCREIPTADFTCFDDVSATNLASSGGVTVMGGSTVYFVVTGYSDPPATQMAVDRGTVHVDFAVAPNTAPVVTGGAVVLADVNTIVTVDITDAESAPLGYALRVFIGAQVVDLNGDGAGDANDSIFLGFESVDRTPPTYVGHSFIDGMNEYTFAAYCRRAGCTQFGITVLDGGFLSSAEMRLPVTDAPPVGLGGVCDLTHICAPGLSCSAGHCAASAAATAACGAAMDLAIATPTTGSTSAMTGGSIGSGTGVFEGSCAQTTGKEAIVHLVVPAGTYDLALTTDVGGATADTVLYLRTVCADGSTEVPMACSDDINYPSNTRSAFTVRDIAPGDYYVFVEGYGAGGASTAYHLQATLVPVLASGTACDPAMSNYRCATGSCSATTMMCP